MSRYSSDSDSSLSYRRKKRGRSRNRSSSRSSSGSRYSSRSKKIKKSCKYKRSRSKERSSKYSRRSRHKSRSSSRSRRYRRRSRSRSDSKSASVSSSCYSNYRDSSSRDKRKSRSHSRNRSKSRSPKTKKGSSQSGIELLEKLNKAAVEAMTQNAKQREEKSEIEVQAARNSIIDEINSPNFFPKSFSSEDKAAEESTIVRTSSLIVNKQIEGSLLHPNLLIEDQKEKLNRWVKKLFQIRQKALCGDVVQIY